MLPGSVPCKVFSLAAVVVASASCLGPPAESSGASIEACTASDGTVPIVRSGHASIRLSGTARDVPLLGDQPIEPLDVAFRVRLTEEDGRIGIQLLSRLEAAGEDAFAPDALPTIPPTAPDPGGDITGSMPVPIDFGEFAALAEEGNRRTALVNIRCRLTGATALACAEGAEGSVEALHAEGVLLAGIGSEITVDLAGPIQVSLEPPSP